MGSFSNDILDDVRQAQENSKPEHIFISHNSPAQNFDGKKANISALNLSAMKTSQPEMRTSQQHEDKETKQVPGISANYHNRDILAALKKQQTNEELQWSLQQQIEDKHRRLREDKLREQEEERKAEEKAKRELEEMAMAYKAEKNPSRGLIYQSFDQAKEPSEVDGQTRAFNRKKSNFARASINLPTKVTISAKGRADTRNQSPQYSFMDLSSNLPVIHEKNELKLDGRVLNESLAGRQNSSEEKLSPKVLKVGEDERFNLLKKDFASKTSTLEEQRTSLKIEAISSQTMKNEAFRELLRLKEELEQKRLLEESQGKEIYQYHSRSRVNTLISQGKIPDVPILKPNRNFNKTLGPNNDYEVYYKNMKGTLEEVSQFVPVGESGIVSFHSNIGAIQNPEKHTSFKTKPPLKQSETADQKYNSKSHVKEEAAHKQEEGGGNTNIKFPSETDLAGSTGMKKSEKDLTKSVQLNDPGPATQHL